MNDSETFEWHDTRFMERQIIPLAIFMMVLLCTVLLTAMLGIPTERALIVVFTVIPIAIVVGWLVGFKRAEKKIPTTVGISDKRTRFLYRGRGPKDILWNDISGIIIKGRLGVRKAIHKDGGVSFLPVPYNIATRIKERYDEYCRVVT
jgi:uncharacterized membrane protein